MRAQKTPSKIKRVLHPSATKKRLKQKKKKNPKGKKNNIFWGGGGVECDFVSQIQIYRRF